MNWVDFKIAIARGLVASAESVANIISGATTVGNADKLDGYHANSFLFLQNFIAGNMGTKCSYYPTTVGKDCNDIDELVALAGGADGLHYPAVNIYYYIVTIKYNDTHKKQWALGYKGNVIDSFLFRTCVEGIWNDWKKCSDGGNADTVDGFHASDFFTLDGNVAIRKRNDEDGGRLLLEKSTYSNSNGNLAMDFYSPDGTPYVRFFENGGAYRGVYINLYKCASGGSGLGSELLHTGNSVPVIVSKTAPTDTSAVWIVPN